MTNEVFQQFFVLLCFSSIVGDDFSFEFGCGPKEPLLLLWLGALLPLPWPDPLDASVASLVVFDIVECSTWLVPLFSLVNIAVSVGSWQLAATN